LKLIAEENVEENILCVYTVCEITLLLKTEKTTTQKYYRKPAVLTNVMSVAHYYRKVHNRLISHRFNIV